MWVALKPLADHSRRRGFTIVELLIVIVVIGILAAITIVTYNGIQVRAQNAKTLVAVDAYKTALSLYMAEHGSPPDYSSLPSGGVCLGTGYPDINADGTGDCIVGSDHSTVVMSALGSSADPLVPYLGKQIDLGGSLVQRSFKAAPNNQYFVLSEIRISPGYGNSTLDGKSVAWWIVYIMQGQGQSCRRPIVRAAGDTTSNTFFSAQQSDDLSDPWRECYEVFIYT